MNIPDYDEIDERIGRDEDLTPMERFVYEHQPSLHEDQWRKEFLAAVRHVTTLPKSCGECPVMKCNREYNSCFCHSEYLKYINI